MANDVSLAQRLIRECLETRNPFLDLGMCGLTAIPEDILLLKDFLTELRLSAGLYWKGEWHWSGNRQAPNNFRGEKSALHLLEHLTLLKVLDIYACDVGDSGASYIGKIAELTTLYFGNNRISDSGAASIAHLINLTTLDINHNQIGDIGAESLSRLKKLNRLDLTYNQIENMPFSLIENIPLEINVDNIYFDDGYIGLSGNPITSPPIEILRQGRQSVLNWFAANKKQLNELKIILIGSPKVGKTSLLRRLKDDSYHWRELATDGINIEDIRFGNAPTFSAQKELHGITAHFWDFGGQETMNAAHQFFLTGRAVYILVMDARDHETMVSQIYQRATRIRATGRDSPIIVVANHIDEHTNFEFINERDLQRDFPQIKFFVRTSCQTGMGLDELKHRLAELIPKAEIFNVAIDERWIAIKDELERGVKTESYLNERAFRAICAKHGITDKNERKNVLEFLRDLGLLLHFDFSNLEDYYVVDPYWITYGVYQLFTSVYGANNRGIVKWNMLEYILNEEEDKKEVYQPATFRKIEYSAPERQFLIDLLNQFKLCFYIEDRKLFAIPDILTGKEPTELTDTILNAENAIRFVYRYSYEPIPIMPHFIARAHQMHILHTIWRNGCVLGNPDCLALVTNYKNFIEIWVTGNHKRKREFMAIVRHIVDAINESMSDKPEMLIPLNGGRKSFIEYEVLVIMEKRGKTEYVYDEYKSTEKIYKLSQLLDGIPNTNEVAAITQEDKINDIWNAVRNGQFDNSIVLREIEKLSQQLDYQYRYLLEKPCNIAIAGEIENAIKAISQEQAVELAGEIMEFIAQSFESADRKLKNGLKGTYEDLKATDDIEVKLKVSIPFLNLLGVDLGVEWKVKSWATKMYDKYELKIFQLMGLIQ